MIMRSSRAMSVTVRHYKILVDVAEVKVSLQILASRQQITLMTEPTRDAWPDWDQDTPGFSRKSPTETIDPWRSSTRGTPSLNIREDQDDEIFHESAELTGYDLWRNDFLSRPQRYKDHGTIGKESQASLSAFSSIL